MLAAIGADSVDALFDEIVPPGVRLDRPLDLPPGKPEQEVYAYLRDLAARNVSAEDEISFLGAGMYDHYVPAIVDSILSRSEVLTPYTPYQPEVSQGTLQVMFEYQTAISELTGLPVSNATLYEAPSRASRRPAGSRARPTAARASSCRAGCTRTRGRRSPRPARGWGTHDRGGPAAPTAPRTPAALDGGAGRRRLRGLPAVPELPRRGRGPRGARRRAARAAGALVIVAVRPDALGVLRPPGDFGVDIAVGEGQPLGNRLDFGGPSFGFFAAREEYLRRMPGPDRGRDDRRGRPPRLRAHAPDARAAHPPREGDAQHHDRADAERARRRDLPLLARPRGLRRARRAAAAAHRLRARGARGGRGRRAAARAARRARVRRPAARRRRRRGDRRLRGRRA